MYSLTIHFGPNAMVWSFLFKDKKGLEDFKSREGGVLTIADDFGQTAVISIESIHGHLIEDLDLVEEARILRSLANARGEVKARQRAATDPVIRQGMQQQGPGVLQPVRFNG